jgi:hypothetical protein
MGESRRDDEVPCHLPGFVVYEFALARSRKSNLSYEQYDSD